jgi:pimeloyl-ACP methyl ester carboxylesterase
VTAAPETRYARNGPIHLAYQVVGSGPPDLLVVNSGPNSHVDYMWAEPSVARFLRRLASFSRLIVYDSRGVGLSDPVPGSAVPAMDEQVDDIRAVLDEAGSRRTVIVGHLAGCAPALVFAAAHLERVEPLVLLGGYARLLRGADYPDGVEQGHIDQITGVILDQWGAGDDLDFTNPSKAGDEEFRRWYARVQRMSASPATAAAMARQWFEVDVRSVLPAIQMPTLVMARATNVIYPAQNTRYLAEHIGGPSTSSSPTPTCSTSPATPTMCWMKSRNSSPARGPCPAPTGSWAPCCSSMWPRRPSWPPRSAMPGSAR